jgi:DNA-binding NtrC family response regulator
MIRRLVLVVDDEPHIRSLLKSILQRENYDVLEASNGQEALDLCAAQVPEIELLLTDIVMPVLDGIQLAERVASTYPNVRVLYMSGKCDIEAVERDIEERGFGFIRKPFAIDELLHTVRKLLETQTRRKAPARDASSVASSAGRRQA